MFLKLFTIEFYVFTEYNFKIENSSYNFANKNYK